ncbi:MAG: hypothetical protein Q9163_000451 [Psora crenata]
MAPIALQQEDHIRDAQFAKSMHGKSVDVRGGFSSMLYKDREAHKAASDDYWKHWDNKSAGTETVDTREARKAEYGTLTRHYYDLATDIYEWGWGACFHFCRFAYGEAFGRAIARHEHYLAHMMQIREGMRVLDVGCGVGGPTREIAKFTGAKIVGLNNSDYQIERATRYAAMEGLSQHLTFTKGDFMADRRKQMCFPANSFDAVYAIEATVHAPSLEGVYSQIYRVLKPGGVFGVYEWLMTEAYDNDNPHHREIRLGIEQGDGISNMVKISEALEAIKAAGFELEIAEDLAAHADARPWYYPLDGDLRMASSLGDVVTIARMTRLGRWLAHGMVGSLERIGLVPKGTKKTADSLGFAAECLVAGGKEKLFTPMYLMIARKPRA